MQLWELRDIVDNLAGEEGTLEVFWVGDGRGGYVSPDYASVERLENAHVSFYGYHTGRALVIS